MDDSLWCLARTDQTSASHCWHSVGGSASQKESTSAEVCCYCGVRRTETTPNVTRDPMPHGPYALPLVQGEAEPSLLTVAATPEEIDVIVQAVVVALKSDDSLMDFLNSDEWEPADTMRFFAGLTGQVSRGITSTPTKNG